MGEQIWHGAFEEVLQSVAWVRMIRLIALKRDSSELQCYFGLCGSLEGLHISCG